MEEELKTVWQSWEGFHLQLRLLHNVVVDTVSDEQVDKHNIGGVDEGDVLQVKVKYWTIGTTVENCDKCNEQKMKVFMI